MILCLKFLFLVYLCISPKNSFISIFILDSALRVFGTAKRRGERKYDRYSRAFISFLLAHSTGHYCEATCASFILSFHLGGINSEKIVCVIHCEVMQRSCTLFFVQFYIRIHFIRIWRLEFAKCKNIFRIKPRLRF